MLKDITFGQYFESRSVLHRADPRVKILLMILLIVFVFLSGNMYSLLFSAVSVGDTFVSPTWLIENGFELPTS